MTRIGIAALKDNLSRHLRAVEAGAEVEVTDRDRVIARIVPVTASQEQVRSEPPVRPFATMRDRVYAPAGWPVDALDLILEERGER